MASTLATNAEVEALASTGLADAALEWLIDAADAAIIHGYGAHDLTDTADRARRRSVLVDLVKLKAQFSGVSTDSIGIASATQYPWGEENRIMARLRSGLVVGDGDDDT